MDVTKMSTEDLRAEQEQLAAERTRVRERQVAVAAELDLRSALDSMPAESARLVKLRLDGSIGPTGESEVQ